MSLDTTDDTKADNTAGELADGRVFEPGTTGWSADDLDDPQIERLWELGRYEIVEGVLTTMPPAYLDSSISFGRLIRAIERFLDEKKLPGDFAPEADYIIGKVRVARSDVVFMTPDDFRRQQETYAPRGRRKVKLGRLLVPPTLIIESVSLGHEQHDRELKRRWYAEAGVPNYWIFNAFDRSIEALILEGDHYRVDCLARNQDEFKPSLFSGLAIPLKSIWV